MSISSANCSAIITRMLSENGIRYVIGSPGSRNFPLLAAFDRNPELRLEMIVDERSAAFSALGIATVKNEPVAVCCTSGSAMLNYGPAVAEAYYRNIPLLVVTADRPAECLGNGEPQMIDQTLPLSGIVEGVFDINSNDNADVVERKCHDAIAKMKESSRPVQLNVRFAEPMDVASEHDICEVKADRIKDIIAPDSFSTALTRDLGKRVMAPVKVLVYVGQNRPDHKLSEAIRYMATRPNIAVVAETISNLNDCNEAIYGIERLLKNMSREEKQKMCPDILISIGGSPTGRLFREYIKEYFTGEVWRIGQDREQNDFYGKTTFRVVADMTRTMRQLASALKIDKGISEYARSWNRLPMGELSNDARVMERIMAAIPQEANVALSNGTAVRYATLLRPRHHRYDSNRGVNGIDGSSSTAIGASWAYLGKTVLITGDMSACYDMSAWVNPLITERFKVIVIDNDGGGIFRKVKPASTEPECEKLACCSHLRIALDKVASSCGIDTYKVDADGDIEKCVTEMYENSAAAMLIVKIDSKQPNN